MNARRGFVPEDERNFSPDAIQTIRTASRHICYLINEGYDLKSVSIFVGNHFLLSERQRLAIVRSVATEEQIMNRKSKCRDVAHLNGKEIWIDGFNEIITLEVMFGHSPLFKCMDGTIRDLASLRGSYRIISETEAAIRLMLMTLSDACAERGVILLDEPVSNSGRLKTIIAEIAESYPLKLEIRILRNVDKTLYGKENIITSDSVILDYCSSWINLTAECVRRIHAEVIDLTKGMIYKE